MANPRLKEYINNDVVPALKEKFEVHICNAMPKITKVVVNKGIGAAVADEVIRCWC